MCRKLTPFDSRSRALEVGSAVVNDSLRSLKCHSDSMFMVTRFTKKMDRNLTLMTLDQEPCQLVLIWLMILLLEPCHTGCMFMVALALTYQGPGSALV